MKAKLPIPSLLCLLILGFVFLGAHGEQTRSEREGDGQAQPAGIAAGLEPENVTSWQEKTNVDDSAALKPQMLLADAVRRLESHATVSANIRHEIDLLGQRLSGSGNYLEQRTDDQHLIRLELKIQLGEKTSSLLQVCDGTFLWTYRKLLGEPKLTRIDVSRAIEGLQKAEKTTEGETPEMLPGLGGLPRVLRGLHASFEFTSAERGRLGKEKRLVWRLRGQWKRGQLAKMLPDQKAAIEKGEPADLTKLPQHLPDQVVLLLGQNDLFPYRIEYRRGDETADRALVTMQLYDVKIDVPIDSTRFIYKPDLEPTDRTQEFLDSLRAGK